MKTTPGLLLSALLLLSAALLPSPARAQPPIDCSNGCYIITCNTQICSLWRCDATGCEWITGWDRKLAEDPLSTGRAAKAPALAPSVAHATVCPPGKRCDLYEITPTEALRLGSYENVDDLLKQLLGLRGGPARRQ